MLEIIQLIISQIKKIPKTYFLAVGVGCVGLILFGYGIVNYFGENNTEKQVSEVSPTYAAPVKIMKSIIIDVEGAVLKPGVYNLSQDSRIKDVVIKAGGFSENADHDFIEKHINLASKVTDGGKIYIPKIGDKSAQVSTQAGNNNSDVLGTSSEQLNINTASADALDGLPGVGPTTALKIINGRPYSDLQELLTKKIVSQKVFNGIKDKVVAE